MSLFTKTIVVRGGLSDADAAGITSAIKKIGDAVVQRLAVQDATIEELRAEIARLKAEPRQSLRARLQEKGRP